MAEIVTDSADSHDGVQATRLNIVAHFTGFGSGNMFFEEILRLSVGTALSVFSTVQAKAILDAAFLFRYHTRGAVLA